MITHLTEVRLRTSDGTDTCGACGNIIVKGDTYVCKIGYASSIGISVSDNICLPCLERAKQSDALSWVVVIAVSVAAVAALCLAVAG